ncbi:MAG TPA: DUF1559 domain-containing protein, partial [Pirellulales bacterium]
TYYRSRSGRKQSITASFPNERTLVFASNETFLKKMITAKPADTGIHRLLRRVDLARDGSLVIDFEKLAPLIVLGLQAYPDLPPVFDEFLPLPGLVTSVEMSVLVRSDVDLQLTLGARDAKDAAELKTLADRAKTMAQEYVEKEIIPGLKAGEQGAVGDALARYARRVTKATLDRVEIAQREKELSLHARFPLDLFATGAAASMFFAGSTPVVQRAAAPEQGNKAAQVLNIQLSGGGDPPRAPAEGNKAARTVNNLKQIGLAMHNYHDANNKFPPPARLDKEGKKPLLSWRVAILPYLDQQALYQEFHLDEPWDSDHNKQLIERMPDVFRSPNQTGAKETTVYLGADGEHGVFTGPKPIGMARIIDGTSNTIMVVEADDEKAVPWTKPEDLKYDVKKPLAGLGKMKPKAFLALFCDGSVQSVPLDIDEADLRALFTVDGKEVIKWQR